MIISHKYKFIFVKTIKTAGTSIEVFLSQCCGENDIVTPIRPPVEPHFPRNYKGIWNPFSEILLNRGGGIRGTLENLLHMHKYFNHIPASIIRCRTNKNIWNNYYKFCVERNPWDKSLSHYHMINHRAGGGISFDEYLERGNFCINLPIYADSKGNLLVDKVVRYESLGNELSLVFNDLGIPFEGSLGVRAKSEHRKDRSPYKKIFSIRQKDIIAKSFKDEINMHKYVF